MDILYPQAILYTPRLNVVKSCTATFNVTTAASNYQSGKSVEFSNEVLISDALRNRSHYSYEEADVIVFDACPYSRHLRQNGDPYKAAHRFNNLYDSKAAIWDRKPCVYMALHPLSYPAMNNKLRFCTALLEDKTINGDDEDVVIPAGAVRYPTHNVRKTCVMTFLGSPRKSTEFADIRYRVMKDMKALNASDACIKQGQKQAYITAIQRSKFCFALPGDTRGGEKLSIAIMNDCVPIIEHYSWAHLPFHRYLNYSKFAIRLPVRFNTRHLLSELRRADFAEYLANLKKAQMWFDYSRQGDISPHSLIWSEVSEIWRK